MSTYTLTIRGMTSHSLARILSAAHASGSDVQPDSIEVDRDHVLISRDVTSAADHKHFVITLAPGTTPQEIAHVFSRMMEELAARM